MNWTTDFIIPVTKLVFIACTLGSILFVIIRAVYIKWNKNWKFIIKYKTQKISIEDKELISSIMDMNDMEIKKKLLVEGFKIKQINELLYLITISRFVNQKTNRRKNKWYQTN